VKKVDLNVDIGEGFPHDEALLEFATSANVCCGKHAGSRELTGKTVELCLRKNVRIGAHPGFPDREGFGRRIPPDATPKDMAGHVAEQIEWFANAFQMEYIKPHGILYTILSDPLPRDIPTRWKSSCAGTLAGLSGRFKMFERRKFAWMLLPGTRFGTAMRQIFIPVIKEGFADRRYLPEGTLVPRSEPGAVLEDADQIKKQVLRIAPKVDSICLHGDTPHCLEFAEMVYKTLKDAGYEVGF